MQLKKDGTATTYAYERTDLAWSAWQASRAAIEVELPELGIGYGVPQNAQEWGWDFIGKCRSAIKSLGLKVKP